MERFLLWFYKIFCVKLLIMQIIIEIVKLFALIKIHFSKFFLSNIVATFTNILPILAKRLKTLNEKVMEKLNLIDKSILEYAKVYTNLYFTD